MMSVWFLCILVCSFLPCGIATIGKKKILFGPKVNERVAVMSWLVKKVEKEPRKGGFPPSS